MTAPAPELEVANGACLGDCYVMTNKRVYWVDRWGWVLDAHFNPVLHPEVDAVMRAILRYERENDGGDADSVAK